MTTLAAPSPGLLRGWRPSASLLVPVAAVGASLAAGIALMAPTPRWCWR